MANVTSQVGGRDSGFLSGFSDAGFQDLRSIMVHFALFWGVGSVLSCFETMSDVSLVVF